MDKKLGKITDAQFGLIPDHSYLMGIILTFSMDGGSMEVSCGGTYTVNVSKECKWPAKGERAEAICRAWDDIKDLLDEAKVHTIEELKGIPVEIILKDRTFKSFRVLTEVL